MNKTTSKCIKVCLFLLSTWTYCIPAHSSNMAFMNDTAGQYFNNEDWKIFEASSQHALSTLPNRRTESWRNPNTGSNGVLMPVNTMQKNGTTCRDLQITNRAKGRVDQYVFTYCKYRNGWKILPNGA